MGRVEQVFNNSLFRQWMDKNKEKEVYRRFCNHDLQHVVDVARILYILFLEEGSLQYFVNTFGLDNYEAAKEVIYAAALLHDVGRWKQYETGEDHAVLGKGMASAVLTEAGYLPGETKIITQAIGEHRSNFENRSFLGEKLYRADKLARPCMQCLAKEECYKYKEMETGKRALIY